MHQVLDGLNVDPLAKLTRLRKTQNSVVVISLIEAGGNSPIF
jgi:hypothetical protein